jgi:hypothetical protein
MDEKISATDDHITSGNESVAAEIYTSELLDKILKKM